MGSSQSDTDGSTKKLALNPTVSIAMAYPWRRPGPRFYFLPEVGMAYHRERADKTSVHTMYLLYHLGHQLAPQLMLRYGLGTFITRISGSGGTVRLMDGDTERDFFVPDESRRTYMTTFDLGAEYRFNRDWGAKVDFYIMGPLSSDKRKLSSILAVTHYW